MPKVLQYIEADVDYCSLTYGVAPCTAGKLKAETKLLLHFDGADAATTIVDSSGNGRPNGTAFGNAQIDTAQKKFGTASLLLDGAGDYITIPASTDFDFGAGDFTIDCWIRRANTADANPICCRDGVDWENRWIFGYGGGGYLYFYASADGTAFDVASGQIMGAIEANVWHHYAVTRREQRSAPSAMACSNRPGRTRWRLPRMQTQYQLACTPAQIFTTVGLTNLEL